MILLALRSMAQRKLRTALTAVAIVLGVAMIAGTYVQTDQISSAFEQIEQGAELHPTFYWRTRTTYHIDYVFVPRRSMGGVRSVVVGSRADWIASGLSDHAPLIIDFDLDAPIAIGERAEIAEMAIPADPHQRPLGHARDGGRGMQPFVEFRCVAPYIGMCRTGHLQGAVGVKNGLTVGGRG